MSSSDQSKTRITLTKKRSRESWAMANGGEDSAAERRYQASRFRGNLSSVSTSGGKGHSLPVSSRLPANSPWKSAAQRSAYRKVEMRPESIYLSIEMGQMNRINYNYRRDLRRLICRGLAVEYGERPSNNAELMDIIWHKPIEETHDECESCGELFELADWEQHQVVCGLEPEGAIWVEDIREVIEEKREDVGFDEGYDEGV